MGSSIYSSGYGDKEMINFLMGQCEISSCYSERQKFKTYEFYLFFEFPIYYFQTMVDFGYLNHGKQNRGKQNHDERGLL